MQALPATRPISGLPQSSQHKFPKVRSMNIVILSVAKDLLFVSVGDSTPRRK
jgi:hypothetical protein